MLYFSKREQLILIFIVIIIIIISIYNFFEKNRKDIAEENAILNEYIINEDEDNNVEADEIDEIMVHISGQVYNPGIVILEPGARLVDAVKAAGGLKKDADLDKINLAKKLSDEEKIYIPKVGEDLQSHESETTSNSSGKININTSTKEELMSLPGIGEVLAERIIEYRNKSKFKSVEDIMNVSGIGEKKFEDIKDLIVVK